MNNADKIRHLITRKLTDFLILENVKPSEINIIIHYPQARAQININADEISEAIEERKEV